MNRDIVFTGEREVTFHKVLWSDNERSLALCLGFTYDVEQSTIKCDMTVTNKISLIEFLKEAFSGVWTRPTEAQFKEKVVQHIDAVYNQLENIFTEEVLPKLGYQDKLYEHQREALFLTLKKRFNFLAYEQGTGKTLIGASISKMLSIKRTLIICPASLKYNWLKELAGPVSKFNELYISLLDANKARTIKAFQERFVICNYESLGKHMDHILSSSIGHIIIDEAVRIKSTSTFNHKWCAKIIEANPSAKVTMLSGSPVRNRINDLFAYLKIVGHPIGSNYAAFVREYTISSKSRQGGLRITGAKHTDKLWREISNFFLRKKKEDCLDLPAKVFSKLHFSMDDYKAEYDHAVREALEKSGKSNLNSCIHSINKVTSKAKLKGIIEFAESILENDEKVVIFSGYTSIVEELEAHFGSACVMINGSVDSLKRSEYVERFMTDPTCKVFIGNTLAAGMGLTLTIASNMIFCDFPFSPADLVQAEDRIHRIGQTKSVNIFYAMANGSVDEHLYQLIADKAHDAAKVIDNKSIDISSDNLAEVLISKLREQYGIPERILDGQEE